MQNENKEQLEIGDLRKFMFAQMDRLNDPACDLEKEIKRADAMISVGKTLIDSAKVEVDFIRVTNSAGTGFIPGLNGAIKNGENQKQLGNGVNH